MTQVECALLNSETLIQRWRDITGPAEP